MKARLGLLLGALGALGCGASGAAGAAQAGAAPAQAGAAAVALEGAAGGAGCPRALELSREAIAGELGCWLSRYVRLDTTNPPGQELAAARFLAELLASEGIEAEIVEAAPGRANLIARLRGRSRGGGVLWMHHMDVVPAAAEEWSVPPFEGRVVDGYLYGRGSLDNKGPGLAQVVAALLVRRLGLVLERDLVLLAVADEESGGGYGARWLTEQRPELFEGVELVLNEGGGVLALGGPRDEVVYAVELAQKAPLWLRVTARGPSGHGGAPMPDAAATVLVRALARLGAYRFPIEVVPEVQAMFAARAAASPEPRRTRYRDLRGALRDPAFAAEFLKEPRDAALVRTSVALTMLAGSPKENVISGAASAVLDVRLLPGQEPEAVLREIRAALAEPALEIEPLLSWRAHSSPRETPLFAAIERLAARRHPGAPVTPNVIGGFTDCNAFRAIGRTCYGFLPIRLPVAELPRFHGRDERVSLAALADGVIDLHALLGELGAPNGR